MFIQYFSFDGDLPAADDQDMVKLFFQPTLPFPLKNGKTVIINGRPWKLSCSMQLKVRNNRT